MEVPRQGVESELQLLAYTTATATWDPSCVCSLHHSSWQRRILKPLSKGRDQTCVDTSLVCYRWATTGTPTPGSLLSCFLWFNTYNILLYVRKLSLHKIVFNYSLLQYTYNAYNFKVDSQSSLHGPAETNPTRNHEVAGLTPGLSQRVKDSVLSWACTSQIRLRSGIPVTVV